MEDRDFSLELLEALPALRKQARSYARSGRFVEDDLVQQACLLAWMHRDQFYGDSVRGWTRAIIRNLTRNLARTSSSNAAVHISIESATEVFTASEGLANMSIEEARDVESLFRETTTKPAQEHHIALLELIDNMNSLPPHFLSSLILSAIDGLSYEEIGEQLDVSVVHARQQVFLARKKLRQAAA